MPFPEKKIQEAALHVYRPNRHGYRPNRHVHGMGSYHELTDNRQRDKELDFLLIFDPENPYKFPIAPLRPRNSLQLNTSMSTRTVFFGYISFVREKVDLAMEILKKREKDYLWFCFDPSRMVQDGPATPVPNLSFSIILDTDDDDEITTDLEVSIRQLPFLSCTLVVEKEGQDRTILVWHP